MKREPMFTRKHIRMFTICIITILSILCIRQSSGASHTIDTELINKTLVAIHRHYIDPDRIEPRKMLLESLNLLQRRVPEILAVEDGVDYINITVGLAKKRFHIKPLQNLEELAGIMQQIVEFVSVHYNGDIKSDEIETTIINGMLDALDPHSSFLSKKVYDEFKVGTRGKFGGLGIVITMKDGMLTVISPIEGTPAARAGLKAGDRIVQIGDESTINMSLTDAVNKLRGKAGTQVTIVVDREGRPSRKVTLTRAIINIDSVKYGIVNEGNKRIGYLRVKSFQSNTYKDVKTALKSFHKDGEAIDGLILDMRNNPGGLLDIAVELADIFLPSGTIVSTVGRNDKVMDQSSAHSSDTEPNYPIIVLINEGSASASEIVAGALQAQNRAVVLGNESFGKGSVQTIIELGNDTALKLTIARYKPAGTESIQLVGVMPDVELIPVTVEGDEINLFPDKNFTEQDLEKHLENKLKGDVQEKIPTYKVRYLKPKEADEELEEESKREYSKKLFIEDDFAVKLARKLIADTKINARNGMLKAYSKLIDDESLSENRKIDLALNKLGIDWSKAPADGKPKLKLTHQIIFDKKNVTGVTAGNKMELQLTATNTGTGSFSRLIAIGQSKEMPFLANREFPFGLIPPGKTRTWQVPIEIPESLATQNLTMDITFDEANGNAPASTKVGMPVKALPQPSFALDYKIPAKYLGKPFAPGAAIPFELNVTNDGPGDSSPETIASISGECDDKVFIEKGRIKLGEIKAKSSAPAKFRFHMLSDYDESNCAIDLTAADIKHRVFITKKLKLKPSEGKVLPPPDTRLVPPTISLKETPVKVSGKNVRISGTIKDKDAIRDYFLFVGDKKIDYNVNPKKTSVMKFEADIPLEPGNNNVVIGARDEEEMTGTKVFVIERIDR